MGRAVRPVVTRFSMRSCRCVAPVLPVPPGPDQSTWPDRTGPLMLRASAPAVAASSGARTSSAGRSATADPPQEKAICSAKFLPVDQGGASCPHNRPRADASASAVHDTHPGEGPPAIDPLRLPTGDADFAGAVPGPPATRWPGARPSRMPPGPPGHELPVTGPAAHGHGLQRLGHRADLIGLISDALAMPRPMASVMMAGWCRSCRRRPAQPRCPGGR